MSDHCEDAQEELSTAKNRLVSEQDTYEEKARAVRIAAGAVQHAQDELDRATDGANGHRSRVASCKDAARAAGVALQEAESNYHEDNREPLLGQLKENLRHAEYAVEDAEKSEANARSFVKEKEGAVSSARADVATAEGHVSEAAGEVAKAETWVKNAQGKVDVACG